MIDLRRNKWNRYLTILKLILDNQTLIREVRIHIDGIDGRAPTDSVLKKWITFMNKIDNITEYNFEFYSRVLKKLKLINANVIYRFDMVSNITHSVVPISSLEITLKGILFLNVERI
jgi:hypothetical protein